MFKKAFINALPFGRAFFFRKQILKDLWCCLLLITFIFDDGFKGFNRLENLKM